MENHEINGIYRAKMVDWMVEVFSAFQCADQTTFLAVNIMDRYFDALNKKGENQRKIELHELHLTGITCIFMASKYEDVYPLLMKTIFNKVGHQKVPVEAIRAKELEILRALEFKVGSFASSFEFLDRYVEDILAKHNDK